MNAGVHTPAAARPCLPCRGKRQHTSAAMRLVANNVPTLSLVQDHLKVSRPLSHTSSPIGRLISFRETLSLSRAREKKPMQATKAFAQLNVGGFSNTSPHFLRPRKTAWTNSARWLKEGQRTGYLSKIICIYFFSLRHMSSSDLHHPSPASVNRKKKNK